MAIRQFASTNVITGNGMQVAFPSSVLSTSVLAVFHCGDNNVGFVSVADSVSTSYGSTLGTGNDGSDAEDSRVFVAAAGGAGSNTVTITFASPPGDGWLAIAELTGRNTSSPVTAFEIPFVQTFDNTANAVTSHGPLSAAAGDDILFATILTDTGGQSNNFSAGTSPNSFTEATETGSGTGVLDGMLEYLENFGGGSISPTMTSAASGSHSMLTIALAIAASGGSSSPTVTPTGFGVTASLGTPTVLLSGVQVSPTGFGLTMSRGTPSVFFGPVITPTGFGLTVSQGTFTTQSDVTLAVSIGFGLTTFFGTAAPGITLFPSGFSSLTMSQGTPTFGGSPRLSPAGFPLTMSVGIPTITNASNPIITPTGFGLATSLGAPSISTFQQVVFAATGFGLVSSLGSAVVSGGAQRILLLGSVRQLNTSPIVRQLVTTPIVRQPHG